MLEVIHQLKDFVLHQMDFVPFTHLLLDGKKDLLFLKHQMVMVQYSLDQLEALMVLVSQALGVLVKCLAQMVSLY